MPRRPPLDPTFKDRSNDEWLAALGQPGGTGRAVEELRSYVRGGLAKVLGRRDDIHDGDLDDFTQDGIARILVGLDTFRGDSRFTTWAMAVAMRAAFSALRRRRFHQPLQDLELGTAGPTEDTGAPEPDRVLERKDLIETLRQAINTALTEKQRTAILGELAGVPSEGLVKLLGTNRNAFYKLHHDARKKLRTALTEAGFGEDEVRQELMEGSKE